MEFFSHELREPDERLLQMMRVLGSQVGQFVARRHAEEEVRSSESRLRAMLEAALDAVVTMDHRGRVIGWNHAAEATFGYRAHETIGQDMADLIVPRSLRASHRAGLARFLETDEPVILDRHLELTGMHKNGTEFPRRADDHEDRARTGRRRSPDTSETSPTASARRRSCAPRVPGSSRSPTPSAAESSAIFTTARSSG